MSQRALDLLHRSMEHNMQPNPQTIELDCPPGGIRPGDLIKGVIAGTGLPHRDDVSRLFGNWVWDYSDIPADRWKQAQPILKERITALYTSGTIRYGSW